MNKVIIGRKEEKKELKRLLVLGEPELIAVTGRLRVGHYWH